MHMLCNKYTRMLTFCGYLESSIIILENKHRMLFFFCLMFLTGEMRCF